jgi:hypothetical protein
VARDPNRRVREAAESVLVEGERITSQGMCWAAQMRPRVPLMFLGRRQYLMALTDRRVLIFERRRRGPRASELVIGKRYETFALQKVRRRLPLMQVQVRAMSGNVMVFEFRPGQRELGGELIARLTPAPDAPSHLMTSLGDTAPAPSTALATGPKKGGSAATQPLWVAPAPPTTDDDDADHSSEGEAPATDIPSADLGPGDADESSDGTSGDDHSAFWERK